MTKDFVTIHCQREKSVTVCLSTLFVVVVASTHPVVLNPPGPYRRALGGPIACSHWWRSPTHLTGDVHRSMGVSVVCMWVQEKRCVVLCVWFLQRGQRGEGWREGLILFKYSFRKGDLFVRSCESVLRVRLSRSCSD